MNYKYKMNENNKREQLKSVARHLLNVSENGRYILEMLNDSVVCRGYDMQTFIRITLQANGFYTLSTHTKTMDDKESITLFKKEDLSGYGIKKLLK